MRLVDADALLALPFHIMIHTDFGDTGVPIEEIENAPTVFDENAYTQGYKQGICDERADKTGHWCEMDECSGSTFQCSRCGGEIKSYYKPKFCEFCGANMRGGEK